VPLVLTELPVLPVQVKGLKYNDFCFIPNQPITPADIAAVASADALSSSSSDASLAAAKQQQQQQVEMQPQVPAAVIRWVACCCCGGGEVSAASAAGFRTKTVCTSPLLGMHITTINDACVANYGCMRRIQLPLAAP
jgi:hypothetical protein